MVKLSCTFGQPKYRILQYFKELIYTQNKLDAQNIKLSHKIILI